MKKLFFLITLFTQTLVFAQKIDDGTGHKIVFQLVAGDSLSHQSFSNNLRNLYEIWPKAEVEVVFHGNGIFMAMTEISKHAKILQDLVEKQNTKMVVCENTMKQKKIKREQLLPFMKTVPMAIAEIVLKQEQGWSYIRSGL